MKAALKSLVLATHNRGKIDEIKQLLSDLDLRLLTGTDLNTVLPDVEEDADTLAGNARKKAETILAMTGIPSLADDTGLEVQALGGRPGVLSARYAGDECNAASNRSKLLNELRDVANRSAAFRTVIALADSDGTVVFEGRCDGRITLAERGAGGFGYDAIFEPEGSSLTFAELTREEKNKISHRARALRKLREYLERGALV